MLETRYSLNKNWTNSEIKELAKKIGVPFAKIYKWHWERNKKDQKNSLTLMKLSQMFPHTPAISKPHQNLCENSGTISISEQALEFC